VLKSENIDSIMSLSYYLRTAWLHSYKSYGYYIPTHYSSVLFRSLQYYRPGLIILTRKD